jgi:hypothetical protein
MVTGDERSPAVQPERVGRVRIDSVPVEHPVDTPEEKSNLLAMILLGILAIALMIGSMLLILSGVFA